MAAPASAVEICNLALSHLDEEAITSINPPTTNTETICSRWYDVTRRALIELHPWNFASKSVVLNRAGTPAFAFADEFNLPPDFIRLLTIGKEIGFVDHPVQYQIEDGQILINASDLFGSATTLSIRYLFDATVVQKFQPGFIDALAADMAVNMEFDLSGQATNFQRLTILRDEKLTQAKMADGQQRPPIRIQRSKLKRARRTRGIVASPFTIFD